MTRIHTLDPIVANRIAAGEVVERPASLAKELCENALDAGASEIQIQTENGGMKRLTVLDNGCGMDREDAKLAFAPHATSKLVQMEDLDQLVTMGFRGEALASIASVSRVELLTRTEEAREGIRLRVEGGTVGEPEAVGCPVGTQIQISDIFYNTPARLKFLKSPNTEAGKITDIVQKLALSRPDVRFVLRHEGRTAVDTPGNGELLSCIQAVFGANTARSLIELPEEQDLRGGEGTPIFCTGFIGQPSQTRNNRNQQLFFVNNRVFRSTLLYRAIDEAYRGRLMKGKHPFVLLQLYLPQDQVDINVHPQKLEVRFRDEQRLYRQVYHLLTDALDQAALPPESASGMLGGVMQGGARLRKDPFHSIWNRSDAYWDAAALQIPVVLAEEERHYSSAGTEAEHEDSLLPFGSDTSVILQNPGAVSRSEDAQRRFPVETVEGAQLESTSCPLRIEDSLLSSPIAASSVSLPTLSAPTKDWAACRPETIRFTGTRPLHTLPILGQAFGTYILLQDQECLWLVDQHAAHEKILFERLLEQEGQGGLCEQPLLFPVPVDLSPQDHAWAVEHQDLFTSIGYQIEAFSENQILLRSQPADAQELDPRAGFLAALDYLSQEVLPEQSFTLQQRYDLLAEVACKAAIKGNSVCSNEEIQILLQQLESLSQPLNCPHGRPVAVRLNRQEMEKWFKRIL